MTSIKKFILICCLILAVSPAAAEVKIGLYLPMTGPAAAMGQMVWEGVQVAHKLQPLVLGQPVKLALVDTKSDRIDATNAVSRLIEKEKVAAIIGEVISSDTLAGVPIAERAGSLNGVKIAQALAETKNFPGITGVITMGPDHNPIKGVTVIKVEKGQFAYQTTINP